MLPRPQRKACCVIGLSRLLLNKRPAQYSHVRTLILSWLFPPADPPAKLNVEV